MVSPIGESAYERRLRELREWCEKKGGTQAEIAARFDHYVSFWTRNAPPARELVPPPKKK
jgi:hypothetical protein